MTLEIIQVRRVIQLKSWLDNGYITLEQLITIYNIGFEYIVDSCAYCKYFIDNKECCTLHDMKVRKDSKCNFYNGGNEHYV